MAQFCLPQHDTVEGRTERERQLSTARGLYEWAHTPGQPAYVKTLPEAESFTALAEERMGENVIRTMLDFYVAKVRMLFNRKDRLSSYLKYYPLEPLPATAVGDLWRSDIEFARQRICGINPFLIRLCTEIPDKLVVTDANVAGLLPPGMTLERLMGERRLFILDYEILEGIECVFGRFQARPIALFFVDDHGTLMPLAIQLGQKPHKDEHIFTPADPEMVWLCARTHLQCADGSYHELVAHLSHTHLAMETFGVGVHRQLAARHPLNSLLTPHFYGTMAINHQARTTLIAPGGPIDVSIAVGAEGGLNVISRQYAKWRFANVGLEADLKARGLDDSDVLPGFLYRDDARRLNACIRDWVQDVVGLFYKTPEDVTGDGELQAWAQDLVRDDGGRVRGLPGDGAITTTEQLIEIVTQVIFTVSGEHAAVGNGQWDQFGFIPNTPGSMYLPPPRTRAEIREIDEANICYALPFGKSVMEQLTLVRLLSEATSTPIGSYPNDTLAGNDEAQYAMDRFRSALQVVSEGVQRRNRDLAVPYTYLDPVRVGRSIAI